MLSNSEQTALPALGLTEAVLMPAISPGRTYPVRMPVAARDENSFVAIQAQNQPAAAAINRGSAAGRAILGARGIQLPGPGRMRAMACGERVTARGETPVYTVACMMAELRE